MDQNEEARRARAKRLRQQIREVTGPGKARSGADADRSEECEPEAKASERSEQESPRDFIHRRMRELAETEKNGAG